MKALITCGTILLALSAVGCTHVAELPGTRFDPGQYPTFAFLPRPEPATTTRGDPAEQVRRAVARALRAKGYRSAAPERASFLVSFYTNLAGPLDPGDFGYAVRNWERAGEEALARDGTPAATTDRPGWEIGTYPDLNRYVNMVVVVDAVDRRAHDLIWRGWARQKTPPADVSLDRLAAAVADVLEQFPGR